MTLHIHSVATMALAASTRMALPGVSRYVLKQTVSRLFDVWDDILWRGMSTLKRNYGSEQYFGMALMADMLLPQLLFHGVSREDVQKRLTSLPSKHRKDEIVIWYHYLAGRVFMANVSYCLDAPSVAFARAHGHRRRGCRHQWDIHEIRWKWELAVFAAIGLSGDLYALPSVV